jgi:hypothetical protein
MNRFLKHWRHTGRGAAFHAHVISYADDFVSLSRGDAARRRSFPARPPRDSRCVALQISAEPPRTDHAHAKIRNQTSAAHGRARHYRFFVADGGLISFTPTSLFPLNCTESGRQGEKRRRQGDL